MKSLGPDPFVGQFLCSSHHKSFSYFTSVSSSESGIDGSDQSRHHPTGLGSSHLHNTSSVQTPHEVSYLRSPLLLVYKGSNFFLVA